MYQLPDLLYLMRRLRDPDSGCPWDLKQDFRSIVPHTLEEAYEVADAIERGDLAHLPGELGDLLFQVVYYSQLGQECGSFDFEQVVDGITRKLLRRHPHVFPDQQLYAEPLARPVDAESVAGQWEAIKAAERAERSGGAPEQLSLLDDIPRALPALNRAARLQKRATALGFEYADIAGVRAALQSLKAAPEHSTSERFGALLFAMVGLGRRLGLDAEASLRGASTVFETCVRRLEAEWTREPSNPDTPEGDSEMKLLWNQYAGDSCGTIPGSE